MTGILAIISELMVTMMGTAMVLRRGDAKNVKRREDGKIIDIDPINILKIDDFIKSSFYSSRYLENKPSQVILRDLRSAIDKSRTVQAATVRVNEGFFKVLRSSNGKIFV